MAGTGIAAAVKAALAYCAVVYLAGFIIGALRVTYGAPQIGETQATLLEIPIMLWISWNISGWCTRRFAIAAAFPPRAAMGALAFAMLMAAEFATANLVFHRSGPAFLASLFRDGGLAGLAAQIAFALFPLLQGKLEQAHGRNEGQAALGGR